MNPASMNTINVQEMAESANNALSDFRARFIEEFVTAWIGRKVVVPHPHRDGGLTVEGEIYDAYWSADAGFRIMIDYWCDERKEYVIGSVGAVM
jgi:hypothetical protein